MHKVLLCWAKVETWNHFSSAEGYIHIQNYRLLEVEEDAAMNDVTVSQDHNGSVCFISSPDLHPAVFVGES